MNITTHCRERYVERLQGIDDKSKVKQIAKDSLEDIEQKIDNLYEDSELVFEGSLMKGQPKRRFNVSDDIILVCDMEESNLLTLYQVDFGFPKSTNMTVLSDLKRSIKELDDNITQNNNENEEDIFNKESSVGVIESDIESLERQIKLLKGRKILLQQDIQNINQEAEVNELKKDKLCRLICNSLDYKRDMLNGIK